MSKSLKGSDIRLNLPNSVASYSDSATIDQIARIEIGRALSELNLAAPRDFVRDLSTSFLEHDGPDTVTPRIFLAYEANERFAIESDTVGSDPSVDVILSASTFTQHRLTDQGATNRVSAIGMGVDHWDRVAADPAFRASGKRFKILHASACDYASGIDLLLEAFAQVFDDADDVSLIIRPTSKCPDDVNEHITRLKRLRPNCPDIRIIDGDLSDKEMKSLFLQCHVFVSSGRYGGFSLPIARAILAGIPVIATGYGGHMDYCDSENSWIVDFEFRRDNNTFTSRLAVEPSLSDLSRLLHLSHRESSKTRFSKAWLGRQKLLSTFTWKDVALKAARAIESKPGNRSTDADLEKIAWVTTWNVQCGIGMYVEHLLARQPQNDHIIFAARQTPQVRADNSNVSRAWEISKSNNGLDQIANRIKAQNIRAVVIQFNFAFYSHAELEIFIRSLHAHGIVICLDLHSTTDPFGDVPNYRLGDFIDALHLCDRIFVHNIVDMNRLKNIGLMDNVYLFPLGVLRHDLPPRKPSDDKRQLLTSFGFAFDTKGLIPLVRAIRLLKDRGVPCKLRMLNAEYNNQHSRDLVILIREEIEKLELDDDIDFCSEFLDDNTTLSLLMEADLFVNPYQRTNESASAAVRYGLAAGVPVAVTPLPFFDDLGDAVYRLPGLSPSDIADGIEIVLAGLRSRSSEADVVNTAAVHWRQQHDYALLSDRVVKLIRALITNKETAGA